MYWKCLNRFLPTLPDNIHRNRICIGPPTLQRKPRYITSWVLYSFSSTNLTLSRSNLRQEAASGESPGQRSVQRRRVWGPSPQPRGRVGPLTKRWVHVRPGKAAQQPFLLLSMKWALSSMKSLTTGVELRSDINIFAAQQLEEGCGKICHKLLPAKSAFIKKWSFRPSCCQGAWGGSSQLPIKEELEKDMDEDLWQAILRKRGKEKKTSSWAKLLGLTTDT